MVASGIRLRVRLFAVLRERFGADLLELEIAHGATAGNLRDLLTRMYPDSADLLSRTAIAINEEYADDDTPIRDGAEVALIPPVSGGGALILVTADELDVAGAQNLVRSDEDGAVCLFLGVVRNHNEGRAVSALEYEAHVAMAEKQLAAVADETKRRFDIDEVALHHRIGRLAVGDVSLLAIVSSHHRREAFEACHWAVDRLKERVPIWKKEFGPDGAIWLEGHSVPDTAVRP
ncbi:MAG TPA: molybdopterin converting factor subunit 1 [Dehalococcoidia bacterium]|nr:molybdopterin converting factor subunit 1 [Dehalococcoidia bacterium]